MLNTISAEIKQAIGNFPSDDSLLFQNKIIPITKDNFVPLTSSPQEKTIAFIDGGQAEILSAGNFCLSFIRVFSQVFQGMEKKERYNHEFYLFTRAVWENDELYYKSTIFPLTEKMIDEADLFISSMDTTIRNGVERASIVKISSMARRFAELSLAARITADFVVLDGTLEATYKNEENYLQKLGRNSCAVAKTSSLFTQSGNNPLMLFRNIGMENCWYYPVTEAMSFVKLHPQAKHIFRFEGNKEALPYLLFHCSDALFLGYPYGLLFADKMARVSTEEKESLMAKFLLAADNKEIVKYLHTQDAHSILDRMG